MKGNPARLARLFLPLSTLLFAGSLMAESTDNTKSNKDQTSPTADQQKMNASDREITQKIRKAINEDKSLATYAHNIKSSLTMARLLFAHQCDPKTKRTVSRQRQWLERKT